MPDGITKMYYESGELMGEANFKGGMFHGIDREYYKSGNVRAEKEYSYNKLISIKEYDENGNPARAITTS